MVHMVGKGNTLKIINIFVSFFLVAFGQPAWIPVCGILASALGYALFWRSMLELDQKKHRFILCLFWFVAAHSVQLSWMTETRYMGPMILIVYLGLLLLVGVQFALVSMIVDKKAKVLQGLGVAGAFTLLEWTRLYVFTGYTWNPAGLSLACSDYSMQLAAIFGVYGLTFWVIGTNFFGLRVLVKPNWKNGCVWLFLVLFPYGYGLIHIKHPSKVEKKITVALVDTSLLVEEKNRDCQKPLSFIPPLAQWQRVWDCLTKKVDLIVLPEAAFPYRTDIAFCPVPIAEKTWKDYFGSIDALPPLKAPFALPYEQNGETHWMATNVYFAKALANHFGADLITGLDYYNGEDEWTNAAFLFKPGSLEMERYDKRILTPVGEYIPFSQFDWVVNFLEKSFGIKESFDVGQEARIFQSHVPIGTPICLEEMYSELVRDLRKKGAELLVSISNDVWFPNSKLARQHFDHARLRAVENGVYLLRASNMGITSGIDSYGRVVQMKAPGKKGALFLTVPVFSEATLYTIWGDACILTISILSFFLYLYRNNLKNRFLSTPPQ